jgi:hypothetical protein
MGEEVLPRSSRRHPPSPPEADTARQAEEEKEEKRVDLIPGLTSEIKSILCMLEDRS